MRSCDGIVLSWSVSLRLWPLFNIVLCKLEVACRPDIGR